MDRKGAKILGLVLFLAGLAFVWVWTQLPDMGFTQAIVLLVGFYLLGALQVRADEGALTYLLPALLAAGFYALCFGQSAGNAYSELWSTMRPDGARGVGLLLLLCTVTRGALCLRKKKWHLDAEKAVGLFTILLFPALLKFFQTKLPELARPMDGDVAYTLILCATMLLCGIGLVMLLTPVGFAARVMAITGVVGLVIFLVFDPTGLAVNLQNRDATVARLLGLFVQRVSMQGGLYMGLLLSGLRGLTNAGEAHRIEHR